MSARSVGGAARQRVGGPGGAGPRRRAARRAGRATTAGFDVVHLHEPLAPGPGYACLVACGAAQGGDLSPRRRRASPTGSSGPLARAPGADGWRRAARCRPRRASTAHARPRGDLRDHRQRHRPRALRHGAPVTDLGPHRALRGTPRGAQGPRRPPRRAGRGSIPRTLTVWIAGEGPDTERLRRRYPPAGRLQWLGRVDDDELASRLAGRPRPVRPGAARRVLRCGPARGHGGPRRGGGERPPGLRGGGGGPRRARAPRRRRCPGPVPSRSWPPTPPRAPGSCAPARPRRRASRTPRSGRCPRWPQRYVAVYERVVPGPAPRPDRRSSGPLGGGAVHFGAYGRYPSAPGSSSGRPPFGVPRGRRTGAPVRAPASGTRADGARRQGGHGAAELRWPGRARAGAGQPGRCDRAGRSRWLGRSADGAGRGEGRAAAGSPKAAVGAGVDRVRTNRGGNRSGARPGAQRQLEARPAEPDGAWSPVRDAEPVATSVRAGRPR